MNAAANPEVYGDLVREVKPHVIRTAEENEAALATITKLMAKGDDLSLEEQLLLELMTLLVERFEAETYPIRCATPAEVLRELLDSHDLKQKDLVGPFGSKGVVSEILAGKRAISKKQAKILADRFHVSAALFL